MVTADEELNEAKDLISQGRVLSEAEKYDEAEKKFLQAIDINPNVYEAYMGLGNLYMSMDKYVDAKNTYKKALMIKKEGEAYFAYGNACAMTDATSEAIENYNLAISAGFDSAEMLFFMGMAYDSLNNEDMALRFFDKAVKKDPSNSDYLSKKIETYIKLSDYEKALEVTENLLKISPEMFDGYHFKTSILEMLKKNDDAIEFSKMASDRFPEDVALKYDYGRALSIAGKVDEAIEILDSAKKMKYYTEPNTTLIYLEAELYAQKAEYDKALELCDEAINADADKASEDEIRFMKANIDLVKKDYKNALSECEKILSNKAKDKFYYAVLYYKAICLKNLGRQEEYENELKEANEIYTTATFNNPSALDIYIYRAMCLKELKKFDNALEIADFVSTVNDNIGELHMLKADIFDGMNRKPEADAEREKAYTLKPELRPMAMSA